MHCKDATANRRLTPGSWLLAGALFVFGCGDSASPKTKPFREPHDLSATQCDETLEATLRPSDGVTETTGVTRYDFGLEDTTMRVGLADESGESLGDLESNVDAEFEPGTGLLKEWHVETLLHQSGEAVAEQSLRGRSLGDGRLWFEILHRSGDDELLQWVVLDRNLEAQRLSLAVELPEGTTPSGPDQIRGAGGSAYEVLEVVENGNGTADRSAVDAWLKRRFDGAFTDSDSWRRLVATSGDPALWQGADAHVRRCRVDETERAEAELRVQQQSVCPYATSTAALTDGMRSRRQAQCSSDPNAGFEFTLQAESALGAVSAGAAITAGLVAAGVVVSGPAIAVTFAVASVAVLLAGNAIDDAVANNQDTIVEAGGAAGEAFWGNDSGDDFADFFGGSNGDPHIDTLDGLAYDFHAAGEFVLAESVAGSPLTIQVRQEPISGVCPNVGVNTAVATEVGGTRVGIYARRSDRLWIDGQPAGLPGGTLALPGGGIVERLGNADVFEIRWPGSERMKASVRSRSGGEGSLDIAVGLPNHRSGQMRGLLGNYNDDRDDDIRIRDGKTLAAPVGWAELVDEYADSWSIDADESLFDYESGADPTTFRDEDFPARPTTLEDLPKDRRIAAEKTCSEAGIENDSALESCIIDVGCTGDSSFVDSHTDREPESDLELSMPIFLDGWSVEGDPSNGEWQVSTDGLSVEQTRNKNPTFFVSPDDYRGVTIRGTFEVTDSDDDFIGFVFGYRSPLAANNDDPESFDTFLLSWKADTQSLSQVTGREGFALTHLSGTLGSGEGGVNFWGREETNIQKVVATKYGDDQGWRRDTVYPFELTYTRDRIVVIVAGELVFDLAASKVGVPFRTGRFGFYNNSQARVHYGGFETSAASADPTASLDGLEYGVDRLGGDYREFEMDTADPRICREACLAEATCLAFTFQRATDGGGPPYCWLKDSVPKPIDDDAYISGVR